MGLCLLVQVHLNFIFYIMKTDFFVWNSQGIDNPRFHKVLKEYWRDFNPDVVVLVETRVSDLNRRVSLRASIGLFLIESRRRSFQVEFG